MTHLLGLVAEGAWPWINKLISMHLMLSTDLFHRTATTDWTGWIEGLSDLSGLRTDGGPQQATRSHCTVHRPDLDG